ncbi:pseudouridine synthase [Psychrosphaera sp. 1_MG-2023]|uniref:pseudouridine synthase n=1 Tax=Psychrosphaera sp. 1_MG-2023 TaxID=3062643 RepID=UPI0026E35AA3|nr:pseudouridine synthase [Psychrosphaera sp. 1_MG-2023]MDO6720631.1 pseudouridine synthase [Psychrosphaera sp. 1_MG-2023]
MQPQADPFIVPKCLEEIAVVFEDEHLIVINKPTKLLSLSGKHPLNIDSVHHRICKDFPTATLIHRLDFGTSGLMLLALNKDINKLLCKQFSERTVVKHYEAVLDGQVSQLEGEIDIPITKDVEGFPLQKVCYDTGKIAKSQFEVITFNAANNTTTVRFKPSTGRTHQLRLHALSFGHPIIGCDLYDKEQSFFKADRLMLHASFLQFLHPISGDPMTFESDSGFVFND